MIDHEDGIQASSSSLSSATVGPLSGVEDLAIDLGSPSTNLMSLHPPTPIPTPPKAESSSFTLVIDPSVGDPWATGHTYKSLLHVLFPSSCIWTTTSFNHYIV